MSQFGSVTIPPSSSNDRVILRIGGRKASGELTTTSRPTSSTHSQPQSFTTLQPQPSTSTYSRPPQQTYTIQPNQSITSASATSQPPIYQAYQPPGRSDSTQSLPAANEVYTISRNPNASSSNSNSLNHSNSAAATQYPFSNRPSSGSDSRTISRAGSTASLPLAVALGSDSFHIPPSSLSPSAATSSTTTSKALTVNPSSTALTSLSKSSSQQVIPVPSLLSPNHKIEVPLIKWDEIAPPEEQHQKTSALKQEFHSNLKGFLKLAKQNIEELTMELFYEDEDESDEDEEGGESKKPQADKSAQHLVTPASLSSANEKQLGSPRKAALLQQLVSLSANMDEGLNQIQHAREAALKRSKEGVRAGFDKGPITHAPKFNKNDIAQLASMVGQETTHPTSASSSSAVSKYPAISDSSKQALAAFVRRNQLTERHRAYEQWVASKSAEQDKALAKKARAEKLARLQAIQEQRAREAQTKAEAEKMRQEEERLRAELEAQRLQEEAEERERQLQEQHERARLEKERLEREEQRRVEREAAEARAKLEEEMRVRAEEEAAWQREKAAREQAENEALRLTEELKKQVARDLAMVTAGGGGDTTQQDARDDAELDALFAEAEQGLGVLEEAPGQGQNDPDTDEEFGEFSSPRHPPTSSRTTSSRPPAHPTGSQSSRTSGPPLPPGALAGRKGRTVARTNAPSSSSGFTMPAFPSAPSLPPSAAAALQGSPQSSRPSYKPMSFGGGVGSQPVTSSTNYRFERAKRYNAR